MGWIAYVIAWFAAVADLPELKFGPTKSTPQYVGRNFSSGNREQGLNRWQDAIRLFEQEQKKPNTGAPANN